MKTLLYKTSVRIIVCIAAVFILTSPLFYLITRYFYAEDMIDIIESIKHGEGIPSSFDLEHDIIAGIMIQYLLIVIVVALSLLIAIRFALRNLWNPFERTLRSMESFKISDMNQPSLNDGNIMEFRRLNYALTELMERNALTYNQQKEFTENASHELQTPLAVMRGRLDILMQKSLDRDVLETVNELYNVNLRMERINRDLLLLAKISNEQFVANEMINAESVIKELAGNLITLGYDVNLILPEEKNEIHANRTLFESLINNLLVNAVRNSGKAKISLSGGELIVSNPSTTNVPLDREKLFRRFSSTSGSKGNGLGLAIAKAVCDFHHWNINYDYVDVNHRFTVRLTSVNQK